jgi:SAM-dependent methyltransferase
MDWRDFWNGEHSIYVSQRHRMLHDRLIARDVVALIPSPDAVVLDYACGEATEAASVARACGRLILSDAAPTVRARLMARFGGMAGIEILPPDEVAALPPASLDLVIINSLLQYLGVAEAEALLRMIAPLLKKTGALVLGDVLPRDLGAAQDAMALLRFGWEGGFLLPAIIGLGRTFFSDYRRLRAKLGLTRYDAEEMLALLDRAGFVAERRRPNLGHNDARMSFIARRFGA